MKLYEFYSVNRKPVLFPVVSRNITEGTLSEDKEGKNINGNNEKYDLKVPYFNGIRKLIEITKHD